MTIKTFFLSLILVLVAAALTAVLVVVGTDYLKQRENGDEAILSSLFSSSKGSTDKEIQFVEIKNLVVTLKSTSSKERYLLLDLAFSTYGGEDTKRTESSLPKIKGTVVAMYSGMDYSTVRAMSVAEMRKEMMAKYQESFGNRPPFHDVVISKMVFQ